MIKEKQKTLYDIQCDFCPRNDVVSARNEKIFSFVQIEIWGPNGNDEYKFDICEFCMNEFKEDLKEKMVPCVVLK